MNISTRRIFFGAALILLGGLFLFQQLFHLQFHVGAIIRSDGICSGWAGLPVCDVQ